MVLKCSLKPTRTCNYPPGAATNNKKEKKYKNNQHKLIYMKQIFIYVGVFLFDNEHQSHNNRATFSPISTEISNGKSRLLHLPNGAALPFRPVVWIRLLEPQPSPEAQRVAAVRGAPGRSAGSLLFLARVDVGGAVAEGQGRPGEADKAVHGAVLSLVGDAFEKQTCQSSTC